MVSTAKVKYDSETMKFAKMNLAVSKELDPDYYPELFNISSAMIYNFTPVPKRILDPEFVYVPINLKKREMQEEAQIASWNILWEAGHLRRDFFFKEIPRNLFWLKKFKNANLYLIPETGSSRYPAYKPLFHLLSKKTIMNFGLPLLKRCVWSPSIFNQSIIPLLESDFEKRLSKAFAHHIWPLINSGSKISAFSSNDPILLISPNLDYWLPFVYQVAENRLRSLGRIACENNKQKERLKRLREEIPEDFKAERPLYGGAIWAGEAEAWNATKEVVELADKKGQLRAIMDAVKSNRIEDDFSSCWSYAREDFERKLYKKRSKVKVSFVELDDTIPVHGPESEIRENLVWEDFIAFLDKKEKQIVVCLRNGVTKVSEISNILGYANHSPISKKLKKIREKARKYLDL
ncbi:MAG: sigma-70 family RNA polymerase sigma factor [Candidatus Scalindua sp.]